MGWLSTLGALGGTYMTGGLGGAAIGGAIGGGIEGKQKQNEIRDQNKAQAEITRYSPWTNMTGKLQKNDANAFGGALQGGAMGYMGAKMLGVGAGAEGALAAGEGAALSGEAAMGNVDKLAMPPVTTGAKAASLSGVDASKLAMSPAMQAEASMLSPTLDQASKLSMPQQSWMSMAPQFQQGAGAAGGAMMSPANGGMSMAGNQSSMMAPQFVNQYMGY